MLKQKMTRVQQLLLAMITCISFTMYDRGAFGCVGVQATTNQDTSNCEYNKFPIYMGGSKDEKISCFMYDPLNELFIIGGNTTSDDFAPASNSHSFMIAVDLDANQRWGKFFYNLSNAVSDISGCKLSSDGSSMIVMGQSNLQPVYMEINTLDGSILQLISIEKDKTSDTAISV